ncbi:MAG: hypothetical protein KDB86_00775 [Actinobacteria bacterium]|nr:hypothetical protein [Actinomycetota bacterium]MCB9390858.1 hypothetical protein [Acidimicrobiia bacterium]
MAGQKPLTFGPRTWFAFAMLAVLVAVGCSPADPDAGAQSVGEGGAGVSVGKWMANYCSTLGDEVAEAGYVPKRVADSDQIEAALEAADGSGAEAPKAYEDVVQQLRDQVDGDDRDTTLQAPYAMCFEYFVGASQRFGVDDGDVEVLCSLDVDLLDAVTSRDYVDATFTDHRETSWWVDPDEDDPLDGIVVKAEQSPRTPQELPKGWQDGLQVVQMDTDEFIAIAPFRVDEKGRDATSAAGPISLTIFGGDRDSASEIVDGLEYADGHLDLSSAGLSAFVRPHDFAEEVLAWMFVMDIGDDHIMLVQPGLEDLDEFARLYQTTDVEGGEATTPEAVDVNGRAGYLVGAADDPALIVEVGDSVLLLTAPNFSASRRQLFDAVESLVPFSPEQWSEYLSTHSVCEL